MARKTRKQRKARPPSVPQSTGRATPRATPSQKPSAASPAVPAAVVADDEDLATTYAYVRRDLRRIGLLAVLLFVLIFTAPYFL